MWKTKNKISVNEKGFTLIEIIVALIILGILAALALGAFFSWIQKSKAAEAISEMSSIKNSLEVCLDTHIGSEENCTLGNISSPNFNYQFFVPPLQTADPGTGISACVTTIMATPSFQVSFNFPGEDTAYAIPQPPPDSVMLARASNGSWSCSGFGVFAGVC